MPTQQISGTIYQMYDASGNNKRFPVTVVDGVLGLRSYLEEQFSSLANLYMGINDVTLSGTVLTVKGVPVNLATVTDLSNYYTKTEADGRYLKLTGGTINNGVSEPLFVKGDTTDATIGYKLSDGTSLGSIGINSSRGPIFYDTAYHKIWHEGNDGAGSTLDADLLDGQHASAIIDTASTNPKSELKTGQEFVFRKTNVEWDAKSGVIKKIKGETRAWNQLVPIASSPVTVSENNVTITDNRDGSYTLNGTPTADTFCVIPSYTQFIAGHKYIFSSFGAMLVAPSGHTANFNSGTGVQITQCLQAETLSLWIYAENGVTYNNVRVWPQITDLTLASLDSVTTADFLALYPGYHPYNPGTLISNDAEAVETTGVNQWDTSKNSVGYYNVNTGEYVSNSAYILSDYIPVIAGMTYYFSQGCGAGSSGSVGLAYFDENKNWIGGVYSPEMTQSFTRTIPIGTVYMRISTFVDYYNAVEGKVCINISNQAINGQYFPSKKSRINLGLKNIKVVSPNVWDEEWEVGALNSYTGDNFTASDRIRTKNYIPVIPGQKYYLNNAGSGATCLYDANKQFIQTIGWNAGAEITLPSNAHYLRVEFSSGYGTTYNNDITINLSNPAFNGRYFSHGTLNLEGGVKGAGSVYDEIRDGKYYRRMTYEDMGDFYWDDSSTYYSGTLTATLNSTGRNNMISSRYVVANEPSELSIVNIFELGARTIWLKDSSITASDIGADGRVAKLRGVKLIYELANEEVYDLAEPLPSVYPCDQFGTERVISPVSVTPSAPFCADIQYGAKSDDIATDLIGTRDAVQPLLDALEFDGPNNAWHLKGNLYADGFVTAYGTNESEALEALKAWVTENFEPKQS